MTIPFPELKEIAPIRMIITPATKYCQNLLVQRAGCFIIVSRRCSGIVSFLFRAIQPFVRRIFLATFNCRSNKYCEVVLYAENHLCFRRVRMRKIHVRGRLRQVSCSARSQNGLCHSRGRFSQRFKGTFFVDGQASDQVLWEDILRFNWDCIIATAQRALQDGLDVVIDYVIEDELPRVRELAEKNRALLYYIVLTADADEIEKRIRRRGDVDLIGRALFLKKKL